MEAFDFVSLRGITVECIVGIHAHERVAVQPLECDIEVGFERRPGGFGASLDASVDYARLEGMVRFVLGHGEFLLLEEAAEALCSTALYPHEAQPALCRVELRKPLALGGRTVPAIRIQRTADECIPAIETNHFGTVDLLHEGPTCGVYLLRIPAGGAIPPHVHAWLFEAELVWDEGLELNGIPVQAGMGHVWPQDVVHGYLNRTGKEGRILCINRPRFDPSDELLVSDRVGEDAAAHATRYFGLP
jgi:dihydroneopterin aldolase